MAHYNQQQEPIITLHALDYIVKCDLTDEPIWNFATFNPDVANLTQLRASSQPCICHYQTDFGNLLCCAIHTFQTNDHRKFKCLLEPKNCKVLNKSKLL